MRRTAVLGTLTLLVFVAACYDEAGNNPSIDFGLPVCLSDGSGFRVTGSALGGEGNVAHVFVTLNTNLDVDFPPLVVGSASCGDWNRQTSAPTTRLSCRRASGDPDRTNWSTVFEPTTDVNALVQIVSSLDQDGQVGASASERKRVILVGGTSCTLVSE